MTQFDQSKIWQKYLGIQLSNDVFLKEREFLRTEFEKFRRNASLVATEIARDLPNFTLHDITHIDSLWSLTDLIIPEDYNLNPLEVFILGSSFLIHDLGLGLAAYPDGVQELKKGNLWTDSISYYYKLDIHRPPTLDELTSPLKEIESKAIENILRQLHAKHAEKLVLTKWKAVNSSNDFYYLLDNKELRDAYGNIIGLIAHSHWWSVDEISKKLTTVLGAPGILPQAWTVDPMKIALILRVADAANVDDRRAPGFLRALRKPTSFSDEHWNFQQKLYQPRIETSRLVYTSKSAFTLDECNSWWLCYDTLKLLDNELKEVDALLAESKKQRLNVLAVAGIEDPKRFSMLINVVGWQPVNTEIKVGDVAQLVTRLGGSELYGRDLTVPIRELIQNSADAIKARRILENEENDWGDIIVRKGTDNKGLFLEVEDTGVGMSVTVLTGPFLDFGQSFWGTPLMHEELPGLETGDFQATGKYGIGFYSVFMISNKVSIYTRRYEDSRESTKCLEFTSGVKARPILRKATADETLKNGGTRIRIYIDQIIIDSILSARKRQRETWTLEEIISKTCVSLDVNVSYQEGNSPQVSLIKANDWITISEIELIKRIAGKTNFEKTGKKGKQLIKNYATNTELIMHEGKVIARAFVLRQIYHLGEKNIFNAAGIVAVNGLNTDRLQNIMGVFAGTNLKASRDSAIPVVPKNLLIEWANSQAKKIAECTFLDNDSKSDIANIIRRLGGNTQELPIAKHNKNWVTYNELVEVLKTRRIPIYLLSDYFVESIEDNFKDTFEVVENVIEADSSSYPILSSGDRQGNDEVWPPRLRYDLWDYETLTGSVIQAMSEAWAIKEEKLIEYFKNNEDKYQEVIVGKINGKAIYEFLNVIDPNDKLLKT